MLTWTVWNIFTSDLDILDTEVDKMGSYTMAIIISPISILLDLIFLLPELIGLTIYLLKRRK